MVDNENLIKWVKSTLGYPIFNLSCADQLYETHIEMVQEDLKVLLSKHNLETIPDVLRDFLLAFLVKTSVRKGLVRVINQYNDNPITKYFDWETFYKEAKEEEQFIYDLIPKLDIYYKNKQW